MTEPSEAELLDRFREGDTQAFAEIVPDDFYIYSVDVPYEVGAMFRPLVRIENGIVSDLREPSNQFYASESHQCILFRGKEPNIHWREFGNQLFQVAESFDVRLICFVGSIAAPVPHTREPYFYGSASDETIRARMEDSGIHPTNYEGPCSVPSFLVSEAVQRGLTMCTIVAGVPPYVQSRNALAIAAALKKLKTIAELDLNLDDLADESREFQAGLDKILKKRPDLAEQIEKLEQVYDEQTDGATGADEPENLDNLREWFDKQGIEFD